MSLAKALNFIVSRSKHKFPKNVRDRIDYSKVGEKTKKKVEGNSQSPGK